MYGKAVPMARPLKLDKTVPIRFDSDQLDRIATVLAQGEDRSSFVREAVEILIRRRERRRQSIPTAKAPKTG